MTAIDADSRVLDALSSTFGFSSFRPLQADIVRTLVAGEDVFVLMPTGGGKSLCYQLPALVMSGVTVVVSPLIALMKDQVDALQALGVSATYINSSLDGDEVSRRQRQVAASEIKLVYVAPERLVMPGFLRLLQGAKLSCFAIDEAHCISEWGHDFRPEYRELKRLRELFPRVPLGAFTATATSRVQKDIKAQLRLERAASFQGSFNRPNVFYDVRPKRGAYGDILEYVQQQPGAAGIIYCGSRAGTEDIAAKLKLDGIRATAYHAGLNPEQRRRRQEAFMRDDVQVVAATIAFGMGIDKHDVRFVMHHDLPKTLENYYQESGRAGRDGEPSDAILFYSPADFIKLRRFAEEKETEEERRAALQQLRQMTNWAESGSCRRRALLAYFDETFTGQDGACCDMCRDPSPQEDFTVPAQMFLSCVKRTGERFGSAYVIDVLRGSRNERVLRLGHEQLSTFGIGHDRSVAEWRALANQLIQAGYVNQDEDRFNAVTVTERGESVLFRQEKVLLAIRQRASRPVDRASQQPHHVALFDRLRALRKEIADEKRIPPFVIFHDSTLRQMAASLPRNDQELRRIQGVGEGKAADFGPAFLSAVNLYVEETGAEPIALSTTTLSARTQSPHLSDSAGFSARMFQAGKSIDEIAAARGFAASTVEGHLVEAMQSGTDIDISRVVTAEKQATIKAAMLQTGGDLLKPVMELLGDGYTYGELRMVRATL